MEKIDTLIAEIKAVNIQGATNVALATLEGLEAAAQELTEDHGSSRLEDIGNTLAYARPTEPLAQNAIRFIFSEKEKDKQHYLKKIQEYRSLIDKAKKKIGNCDEQLIKQSGTYLTHCHSGTVAAVFINAKKQGKEFAVFVTETRPKFQGRITVKELLDAGIKDVHMLVDSEAAGLLEEETKKIDAVFIGADLLNEKGFVNKVGSLGICRAAVRQQIPVYCVATLLKYDPRPFSPQLIEQRSGEEIWKEAPPGLSFYAPAFDFIPYEPHIKILCEAGVIDASTMTQQTLLLYPFLRPELSPK